MHVRESNESLPVSTTFDDGVVPEKHRSVQVLSALHVVQHGAKDIRRVDEGNIELDFVLVLFHELPRCALRKSFACMVLVEIICSYTFLLYLAHGILIPVTLIERKATRLVLGKHGRTRGGDNHALDGVIRVLERRTQRRERAVNGGADKVLRVVGSKMERRRGMCNGIDALNSLVKSTVLLFELGISICLSSYTRRKAHLGDVRDDGELEPVCLVLEVVLQVGNN